MEMPSLKTDQCCEKFKVSKIPALREKLDEVLELILRDMSNLEQELLAIEAKVQELERDKKERKIYMDNCAIVFHVQDFERGIRNDTMVLQAFLEELRSKSKALTKARSEVVARHACICWEVQAVLLSSRETPQQQHQEQEMPNGMGAEASSAHELEEEEAKKLEHNLSTVEQDMTAQLDDAAAALEKEELDPLTAPNANSHADQKAAF
ncbi:uncharacterized protein LOC121937134 [Sceloporus undulatus]|uniref:uncharacterized protein LOC121937134 n=1 Tax=Sceloporus undulatus TaxID=8520 RepID=UPI001C4AD8C6|nr:uncharacterized protein LOC121937134 [Sceloporus undulatus]